MKKIWVNASMAQSVSSYIKSLDRNKTAATTRLITGLTAILTPQPDPTTNEVVSEREFCYVLGLNRNSKYFEAGLRNRKKHNCFKKFTGNIAIGESVIGRGCDDGILLAKGSDGVYTIKLFPFGTENKYYSISSEQLMCR